MIPGAQERTRGEILAALAVLDVRERGQLEGIVGSLVRLNSAYTDGSDQGKSAGKHVAS